MVNLNDIVGKAKKVIEDNPEKVSTGLDKVGELVDKGTKGKFTRKIEQGRDLAKEKLTPADKTTVAGHPSPAKTSPAGPQTSPAAEADKLGDEVRPTTGETYESDTVVGKPGWTTRAPGQVD